MPYLSYLSPLLLYLQQDDREEQTVLKREEEIQHGPQKGEFMPRVSQSVELQDTNHEKTHRLASTEQPSCTCGLPPTHADHTGAAETPRNDTVTGPDGSFSGFSGRSTLSLLGTEMFASTNTE